MQPGVVTTAKVQREMARDLARHAPSSSLARSAPAPRPRTTARGRSSGVHVLDDYHRPQATAPAARFGDYLVLARR